MTFDEKAPERLATSSEDSELRALLDAGRDELPSAGQLEALAAKLGPIVGPGGTGHGGPGGGHAGSIGAAVKSAIGGTVAKVLGTLTLATVLGVAVVHGVRKPPTNTALSSPSAIATLALIPPAPPTPPIPPEPLPSTALAVAPLPTTPAPTPRPPIAETDPDAEVSLLQRAQDALPSDPATSLALATEHARRFPRGMLAQEREVLAIEALVHLGRTREARARADRFRAAYPSSTHLSRIDAVLAGSQNP